MRDRKRPSVVDEDVRMLEESLRDLAETLYWYPSTRATVAVKLCSRTPRVLPLSHNVADILIAIKVAEDQ